MRSTLLPGGVAWALFAALLCAGCGGQGTQTYVGTVAGTDAMVGAVSDGQEVAFYLCGGPTTFDFFHEWFTGDVGADGTFSIASEGFTLTGSLVAGSGTIAAPAQTFQGMTSPAQTLRWTAGAAGSAPAGLYSAMNGACRIGVVVEDAGGAGTVVQGVWCEEGSDGDRFAQVVPILPIEVTAEGLEVRVDAPPTPVFTMDVEPVTDP